MVQQQSRPYVICHLLTSLDGRISGSFFGSEGARSAFPQNRQIREQYDCHAVINGRTTCAEIYADGYLSPCELSSLSGLAESALSSDLLREDCVVITDAENYVICVDAEGTLNWNSNTVNRPGQEHAHVIVLLTDAVSDAYLSYLRSKSISYLIVDNGKGEVDLSEALRRFKRYFGIEKLMVTGGGIMDWSLLSNGLMDEISLVVAPSVGGETGIATSFDRSPWAADTGAVDCSLLAAEVLEGGTLWLRYQPANRR